MVQEDFPLIYTDRISERIRYAKGKSQPIPDELALLKLLQKIFILFLSYLIFFL